ncbi:MAG TPA: hypothetical protein GX527_00645 [Clostridiaceae bacterium]|jgi:rubrerythrin|nr:hypothetical protein [Clostridiaceae bacterium]
MSLTTKELLLIQDNIKMTENAVKFMEGCTEMVSDPQVKGMCQQMAKEHQNDIQVLMKHISSTSMQ